MSTPSLFVAAEKEEIVARLRRLRPDSRALWGKMDAAQMLAHCQVPIQVALGEVKLRRRLIGILLGPLARKSLDGPEPTRKNLPTDPTFRVTGSRDFERERAQLVELIERHAQRGVAGLSRDPHPFFGRLSEARWQALMWKHLDHHLRQFGV
jgi:hypothetical protein